MISRQQTEILNEFLRSERFTDESLIDDLVDHLSCEIESRLANEDISFEEAFELAKQKILSTEPIQVQKDLEFLTTKTQNIMIKKIAFIGGYASILCFCLTLLFFTLSSYSTKKTALMRSAAQQEYYAENNNLDGWAKSEGYTELISYLNHQRVASFQQFVIAEKLFILGFILIITTYLPYVFYSKYNKTELALGH